MVDDAARLHELHTANRTPAGYLPEIERADIFVVDHEARTVGSAIMAHALAIAGHGHEGPIRVESTQRRALLRAVERSSTRRNHVDIPIVVMERA